MAIKQRSKSLHARSEALSDTFYQLEVLNNHQAIHTPSDLFQRKIQSAGRENILPSKLEILQINLGKLCNQTCAHCHVDAGPDRTEIMVRPLLEKCLDVLAQNNIGRVDLTGGAPELNPNFRWFVESCHALGIKVMDRCNLTIIRSNPKYHDLPLFFAQHGVQVISSLPHFTKNRTDSQRGEGVFEDSIKALQMLNEVGYGQSGTGLELDLVYNPSGAFLPGDQITLQEEFKLQLNTRYGIVFNQLYAITNLPISRFLEYLIQSGNYESYMETLIAAFNPATLEGLMCRNTLSVSWDGYLYDCDFNQMLNLKVASSSDHLDQIHLDKLSRRKIVVNQHCFGCTAGAGSSCGGAIA